MRRRTAAQADSGNEKVRSIRVRTDDVYGGMLVQREQQDQQLMMLAGSIARYGLLQPVVVRRNPAVGRYALVCGTRRLAACRLLGIKEINAVLIEADEDDAVSCFLQEHLLHCPTHVLAEAELAAGREEVERAMPDGGVRLRRAAGLLALPQPVKNVIRRYGLSLEQTEPLLSVAPKDRQLEAAVMIAERGLSPAQVRRMTDALKEGHTAPKTVQRSRRRLMKVAMEETSRMAERLRACGLETGMTVHAQESGVCVQILICEGKKAAGQQENENKPRII